VFKLYSMSLTCSFIYKDVVSWATVSRAVDDILSACWRRVTSAALHLLLRAGVKVRGNAGALRSPTSYFQSV